MQDYFSDVLESVSYINERITERPSIAIILGSGLGKLADEVTDSVEIPYEEIPNFPVSKVVGHENKLIVGKIYDKNVIVMQGRFHYYEGFDMKEVTFPIKVFALLGVTDLIVTNAAGGINKKLKMGDLVLIRDHINISGLSPLRGNNDSQLGPRFPNMKGAYSERLIQIAREQFENLKKEEALNEKLERKDKIFGSNKKETHKYEGVELSEELKEEYSDLLDEDDEININLYDGVYAFMPGPQYETAAEIKMLEILGADCVGMSTVPEVISAVHSGIDVLGLSCITNLCNSNNPSSHQEVIEVADKISDEFVKYVLKIIKEM